MQTPPEDILTALNIFDESDNKKLYVKGRRMNRPISDGVFTFGMSIFESILFGYVLYDINAQPNIFQREFLDKWKKSTKRFFTRLVCFFISEEK